MTAVAVGALTQHAVDARAPSVLLAETCPVATAAVTQFNPTGAEQCFTVPPGVTEVEAILIGGFGGTGYNPTSGASSLGGNGAGVQAVVNVTPGERLYVEVASAGYPGGTVVGAGAGGGNGGGNGGSSALAPGSPPAAGGGGATDLRSAPWVRCGPTPAAVASLASRILVAGGGGGGGETNGNSAATAVAAAASPRGRRNQAPTASRRPREDGKGGGGATGATARRRRGRGLGGRHSRGPRALPAAVATAGTAPAAAVAVAATSGAAAVVVAPREPPDRAPAVVAAAGPATPTPCSPATRRRECQRSRPRGRGRGRSSSTRCSPVPHAELRPRCLERRFRRQRGRERLAARRPHHLLLEGDWIAPGRRGAD